MRGWAARRIAFGVCLVAICASPGTFAAGGQTHDLGFIYPGKPQGISSSNYRHLQIQVWIDRIENHAVDNGGIDASQYWLYWDFSSSVAEGIPLEMPAWPIFPTIGVPIDFDPPGRIVYNGQVPNGCNSDVDLQLHFRMTHKPTWVADVTFNDHIPGHGFYNVYIPVHAVEDDKSSDFVFRGRLNAVCSNVLY